MCYNNNNKKKIKYNIDDYLLYFQNNCSKFFNVINFIINIEKDSVVIVIILLKFRFLSF